MFFYIFVIFGEKVCVYFCVSMIFLRERRGKEENLKVMILIKRIRIRKKGDKRKVR